MHHLPDQLLIAASPPIPASFNILGNQLLLDLLDLDSFNIFVCSRQGAIEIDLIQLWITCSRVTVIRVADTLPSWLPDATDLYLFFWWVYGRRKHARSDLFLQNVHLCTGQNVKQPPDIDHRIIFGAKNWAWTYQWDITKSRIDMWGHLRVGEAG